MAMPECGEDALIDLTRSERGWHRTFRVEVGAERVRGWSRGVLRCVDELWRRKSLAGSHLGRFVYAPPGTPPAHPERIYPHALSLADGFLARPVGGESDLPARSASAGPMV